MLGPNGQISTSLQTLKQLSEQQYEGVRAVLLRDAALLADLDKKQSVLSDYVTDQQAHAFVQKRRQEDQLKLEAASAGVYLLSTIAGLGDKDLGKAINVTGSAAIQITEAVSKYTDTVSKLGDIGSAMASVALSANFAGAVMNVVSLFGSKGPTIDQIVLNQIIDLRNQVSRFSTDMHTRFDRVDAGLNQIYYTLNIGLAELVGEVRQLDSKIDKLRSGLFDVETGLNRLEQKLTVYLKADSHKELQLHLHQVLVYKMENPQPMPYQKFFDEASEFFLWATVFDTQFSPEMALQCACL